MKIVGLFFIVFLCELNANAQTIIEPLSPGFELGVRALEYDSTNNILYAGGDFEHLATGESISKIAKWNGLNWDSVSTGVNDQGNVITLEIYNGDLIAGGTFNQIGGIYSKGIASWNGSAWNSIGNAYTQSGYGCVTALFSDGNELYVGGCFDTINGIAANKIAMFNGLTWQTFPTFNGSITAITAIIKYNNELYLGGNFYLGPGKSDIIKFDGTNWISVSGGFTGPNTWVNCFSIYQNKLYVGGYFQTANGDPGNNIAIWDGSSWSQPGSGVGPSNVLALGEFNGDLYVGGQILNAGSIPVSHIAKWDGINWSNIGYNFNELIGSFTNHNNELFIGGGFHLIDSDTINCVAKLILTTSISELNNSQVQLFPIPASQSLVLPHFLLGSKMRINNTLGELVQDISIVENEILNIEKFSSGSYFITFELNDSLFYSKVIIIKDNK